MLFCAFPRLLKFIMLSATGPVRALLYLGALGFRAFTFSVLALFHVAFKALPNKKDVLVVKMDSGDAKNVSLNPEESKGGVKFEVIYADPTSPPPNRNLPLSPKTIISVENIDNKLKAANERRKTLEAVKIQHINDKNSRIEEAHQKKQEKDEHFKQQSKAQLENKIVRLTEAREAVIAALLERLREHDKHIAEVRKQMEEQTDQLRERSQKKLEQAQDKRQSLLKDIQEKRHEHLQKVEEIRLLKASQGSSGEATPEANENEVSFSG